MSLNIKNERVHALAREAARRTGKNQTRVIEDALVKLLADLDRTSRRAEIDDIIRDMQRMAAESPPLRIEDLYDDETGLPI